MCRLRLYSNQAGFQKYKYETFAEFAKSVIELRYKKQHIQRAIERYNRTRTEEEDKYDKAKIEIILAEL